MPLIRIKYPSALLLALLAAPAAAQESPRAAKCVQQFTERTAIFVAQDWPLLLTASARFLRECRGVFPKYDEATAFESIAIANLRLGSLQKAIQAADRCTQFLYSKYACHLRRAEALVGLGNLTEAEQALARSERLIQHQLQGIDLDMRTAQNAAERELVTARREELVAMRSEAAAFRELHFPK